MVLQCLDGATPDNILSDVMLTVLRWFREPTLAQDLVEYSLLVDFSP
jgi:hypothetical protein